MVTNVLAIQPAVTNGRRDAVTTLLPTSSCVMHDQDVEYVICKHGRDECYIRSTAVAQRKSPKQTTYSALRLTRPAQPSTILTRLLDKGVWCVRG